MGMKDIFHKMIGRFLRKKFGNDSSNTDDISVADVTVLLRCGSREIVGDEYNKLARMNAKIQETEFGSLLFYQWLSKYGIYQHLHGREDGIEYAYNFQTEENLNSFVEECSRYLG